MEGRGGRLSQEPGPLGCVEGDSAILRKKTQLLTSGLSMGLRPKSYLEHSL